MDLNALRAILFGITKGQDKPLKRAVAEGSLLANDLLWGGGDLARPGVEKFLGLAPVSANEPFPIKNIKVDQISPEAKAILESLSVGQEIPYGVTNAGGDNRFRVDDSVQTHFTPDGLPIDFTGIIDSTGWSPGKFKLVAGKDETGPYVEMSDVQDFHPEMVDAIDLPLVPDAAMENTVRPALKFGVDLMNALGKPFESKSRYHFDPITWEILQK